MTTAGSAARNSNKFNTMNNDNSRNYNNSNVSAVCLSLGFVRLSTLSSSRAFTLSLADMKRNPFTCGRVGFMMFTKVVVVVSVFVVGEPWSVVGALGVCGLVRLAGELLLTDFFTWV